MMARTLRSWLFAWAALTGIAEAQTRIDLRTQGKNVDFSASQFTSPSQTGTQLPATCQVGQTFLKTNAPAGQSWYSCTAVNQWRVQGAPSITGIANSVLATDGTGMFWRAFGGDIGGQPGAITVSGLMGRSLSLMAPAAGQSLTWNGSQWAPQSAAIPSVFGRSGVIAAQTGDYSFSQIAGTIASGQLPAAGGDVSGGLTAATVTRIQNQPLATTAPAPGQVLTWSGAQWAAQNVTAGVSSVFGRSAAITAQSGDYTFSQIGGTVANAQLPSAGGDVSGSLTAATVKGLQGLPIGTATPLTGQRLVWNGTQWTPQNAAVSSVFGRSGAITQQAGDYTFPQIAGTVGSGQLPAAGGDVSGSLTAATVKGLQGLPVGVTVPTMGQMLAWNGTQWGPQSAAVASIFGRSGTITGQTGDYTFSQIAGTVGSGQLPAAGGDVSGGLTATTVKGLQGFPVGTASPSTGQVLTWSGAQWAPQNATAGVASVFGRTGTITQQTGDYSFSQVSGTVASGQLPATGGDVSGSLTAATVTRIQNRPVVTTAPSTGQLLAWSGTQWAPQSLVTGVASVFGRTGTITQQTADYTFSQIAGTVASGQLPAAGGDVSGGLTAATVTRIQSQPVAAAAPSAGQVLAWGGTQWAPQSLVTGVSSAFGRSGTIAAQTGDYSAAQVTNAVDFTVSTAYSAGARQTLTPSASSAGLRIAPGALPNSSQTGDIAVDSGDSNKLKLYNGTSWVSLTPTVAVLTATTNYAAVFSSQTTVSVPGSTHLLGTSNVLVACYDNSSPANLIEANRITVDPISFDVTITFATAQSGTCVISGSSAIASQGGGSASSSSGGAGMAAQLGDFAVAQAGATELSIGANCSAATPCNVRFGSQVMSITLGAVATITGGTGTAYIYISSSGVLTAGSAMTVTCSGSCVSLAGVTAFPVDSVPIATWTATSGTWNTSGGLDRRGWLSGSSMIGGAGIVTVQSGGQTTITVDSAVVPTFLTASATLNFPSIAAGTCSADMTFTMTGANPGDSVAPGWPGGLEAGLSGTMRVSAAGQIAVRLCAQSGPAIDPASATFRAVVVRGF